MNNPNPFVPKGSLLEQQSKRRSQLKVGVLLVLAVGIASLAAILIQGCKREEAQNPPDMSDGSQPPVDTNSVATTDTNLSPTEVSNPPVSPSTPMANTPPPVTPPAPVTPPPPPAPTENEYVIVKGDTFAKIAKANGVTVRAIEDANPGVTPTRLKVGQKLVVPAGATPTTGGTAAGETANGVATATGGDEVYTIKSGDTLTHIAHHFGVTVKALEAENNLSTTKIKVGQKLNIPAKPEAALAPGNQNEPPPSTAAPQSVPMQPAPASSNPSSAPGNPPPSGQPNNSAPGQ